ncbi:outer membrane protein assembly factor BamC [Vibrio sp. JC009]|uniref:outer membrane protein assembly factor BamC n=1 Tax=Vibrio sp. JC009 TaxID=2912314 RepID=UPI0023B18A25|nr:outer membrane protein assembly factor BamC [Vibrio sp. JC009]WED21132.1 outer membrane protein assembly factor BamC [Vibrio sp. JC009]
MKFSRQLVVSSLAVVVLSACSGSPKERRQAKDDFDYLKTEPFSTWVMPEDSDPQFYPNYDIPAGNFEGPIGRDVDIRPPQQILELIPGARYEQQGGEVTMWLIRENEVESIWQTALNMAAEQGIALRENSDDYVETDWVAWESEDEDSHLEARYALNRFEANNRYGFKVSMLEWREDGVVKEVSKTNLERYNIFMTNLVTSRYDQDLREEAFRKAQELVKNIPVMMGKDRSGLPVIIARAQYNVFWERAVDILPKIGFELEERNRSQGYIKTKYSEPDDEFWEKVGTKPFELAGSKYTFSLGDLGNRTSISISDSSGKPVTEEVLESIVPALVSVIGEE